MSERKFASTLIRDSEDKLGLTPEEVNKLLADTNTTVAKTKGFTRIGDVEFEDGLIFTSLIKLLDAGNDGDEMAGISGIAGVNKKDPAFWAGGSYDQAIGGTAKAIIRHDGSSKFTDAEIEGKIKVVHANGGGVVLDSQGLSVFNALGNMNIQFGLKNGYAVMEYYDNDGNLLYDLGPGGISKVEVREEKWVEVKLVYLGFSFNDVLTDYQIMTKYKTPEFQNETTFYRYVSKVVAGQNQDPTNDGKIFENNNKESGYITPGVYMRKTVGMQMEMLTENTGTRIYPPGIQPYNEAVFDKSPLYFVQLMYYAQGAISSTTKAYWNPGISPS